MMNLAALWRAIPFLFLSFFLIGCFPLNRSGLEEEKDPHYLEGQKRLNARDSKGAIQSFERALQTNPGNSAAHFQLGILYEKVNDPASALYHFRRHLALNPKSNMADYVKDRITECTRQVAREVALVIAPGQVQQELTRLVQANDQLQQQVSALQQQLAQKPRVVTNVVYVPQVGSAPSYEQEQDEPEPEHPEPPILRAEITPTPSGRIETEVPSPSNDRSGANTSGGWVPTTITPPAGTRSTPTTSRPSSARSKTPHRLKKGETIAALSRQYRVSIADIIAANPGIRPNHVQAGQIVYIPAR